MGVSLQNNGLFVRTKSPGNSHHPIACSEKGTWALHLLVSVSVLIRDLPSVNAQPQRQRGRRTQGVIKATETRKCIRGHGNVYERTLPDTKYSHAFTSM
ncbi:hypothetical protein NDU88_002011 [Pleurodeles waltl]|uniref:Uncharacterized protein n=1 Tax=Pleurodeles waltl TaxID=8319 RepID=A0AAV7VDD7_PLEWA|nr:hypothetical protein NDU88_002011 [Pleurodeles waltl]